MIKNMIYLTDDIYIYIFRFYISLYANDIYKKNFIEIVFEEDIYIYNMKRYIIIYKILYIIYIYYLFI